MSAGIVERVLERLQMESDHRAAVERIREAMNRASHSTVELKQAIDAACAARVDASDADLELGRKTLELWEVSGAPRGWVAEGMGGLCCVARLR